MAVRDAEVLLARAERLEARAALFERRSSQHAQCMRTARDHQRRLVHEEAMRVLRRTAGEHRALARQLRERAEAARAPALRSGVRSTRR